MLEQVVDGFRKASEASLQLQQDMFKQWSRFWLSASTGAVESGGRTMPPRWFELGLDMLDKQRGALDWTYRSGIQLIEQTLHVGEAQSGDDYRRLTEDLWKKLIELQKSQVESQLRDYQALFDKAMTMAQEVKV